MSVPEPTSPPPFLASVRALYDAFDAFDAAAATRLALHRSDLSALTALEQGPRRIGDVGHALGLSSGAMTALADRLVESGHLKRSRDPKDRRAVLLDLTSQARAEVATVYRQAFEAIVEAVGTASAQELETAAAVVQAAAHACTRAAAHLSEHIDGAS
ncbi:MAG: MarR family winged helix-turn-helix transcriptional regulator [Bacteroidota bacterium]